MIPYYQFYLDWDHYWKSVIFCSTPNLSVDTSQEMMRKTIWWEKLLWIILMGNCVSDYNEEIAKDVDLL